MSTESGIYRHQWLGKVVRSVGVRSPLELTISEAAYDDHHRRQQDSVRTLESGMIET